MFSAFTSNTKVYLTENSMRNAKVQPLRWPRKSDFALCTVTMACEEEEEKWMKGFTLSGLYFVTCFPYFGGLAFLWIIRI